MVVDQSLADAGLSRDHGHTSAVDRVLGDDMEGGKKNSFSGIHEEVSVMVKVVLRLRTMRVTYGEPAETISQLTQSDSTYTDIKY